jgi:glycosyltransferase involved in cell wall biosynthesis
MEKEIKPTVYIAMPCYDSVKINTMLSVIKLVEQFRQSGIKMGINTMKSPLIHQARNYLTSVFLTTEYQYLLFIDSDVEFEPDAIFRMLVAKKEIICTPYRVKAEQLDKHIYTVEFKDPKNIPILPGGLVELEAGPTGLMLIDRTVFEKIIKNHPDLKIKNKATPTADKSLEFYYNFFDFGFDNHYATGEDISFCKLAKENDFKIYANTESTTRHHGSWAWEGKFKESLNG